MTVGQMMDAAHHSAAAMAWWQSWLLMIGILAAIIVFAYVMETLREVDPRSFRTVTRVMLGILVMAIGGLLAWQALAHDHARPGLNGWYQSQKSGRGPCCDGPGVDAKDGRYRVRIEGEWIDVPDDAVLPGPNLDGRTIVWPMTYQDGSIHVRCFIPGVMT